ncbi:MAG TPA: AraC family transcriptional regulator ligand-binding domain-containing protein [Burkholderiaceae bacterium]|nr:AraC family transcriptional regulator ligand-binding domain-containing protein [Burkholderiaceae bacterium]
MRAVSTTVLAMARPEIWETIPGARVLNIIEAFGLSEIDVAPSLPRFGIEPPLKNDTPVPAQKAGAWLEYLVETFPERGVGLHFSRLHTLLDNGMVGYTILSSDTVGEALAQRIHFSPLLRPYFGMQLQAVDGDLAELVVLERDPPGLGRHARAFSMEQELATWVATSQRVLGPGHYMLAVHCAYPDPRLPERYQQVFGCPVHFDQSQSRVQFRRELLEQPLAHAHSEAHEICKAQCELLLAQLTGGRDTTTALRRLLLRRPRKLPDLEGAAAGLHISARTLRRRLRDEGTSFSQVLSQTRMLLARDYLRTTGVPVADIASLLGFADESSLSRSFRRVHQTTPRRFRAREVGA